MNKNVDKNAYKEVQYGKKQLVVVSALILIVGLLALVGGIVLLVKGITVSGVFSKVWRIILAVVFTSMGMLKNNSMNVKDGNRAKGTLNVLKCDKCGYEVEEGAEFCKNCGASLKDYIECECGTRNPNDAEHCSKCGKALKK